MKREIVESKHDRVGDRSVTYQLEFVLCGKPGCSVKHGPYWYAYWKHGRRTCKSYVGKEWRPVREAEALREERVRIRKSELDLVILGNHGRHGRKLPKKGPRK